MSPTRANAVHCMSTRSDQTVSYVRNLLRLVAGPPKDRLSLSYAEAYECLDRRLSGVLEVDERRVLHNQEVIFFPVAWIGCCGHLVERATGAVIQFGSAEGPEVHIWAHHRGFAEGETGDERRQGLTLANMTDEGATLRLLSRVLNARVIRNTVVPALRAGEAVRVDDLDLYFGRGALLLAEMGGAFAFQVHPAR